MKTKQIKPVKAYGYQNKNGTFILPFAMHTKDFKEFQEMLINNKKSENMGRLARLTDYKIIPVLITPIIYKPKSLLGTSKMIIKKGKPKIV